MPPVESHDAYDTMRVGLCCETGKVLLASIEELNLKSQLFLLFAALSSAWAQGGFNGPGRYEIANVQNRLVLDLDRNDRRTVIQFDARRTDNQIWQIEDAGGGFYFIRNAMNGYALEAIGDRNSTPIEGNPFHGGATQQWRIGPSRRGSAKIFASNGKSLDIPDGTNRPGVRVQIYNQNDDPNQDFFFRRANGGLTRWQDGDRRRPPVVVAPPPPVVVETPRGDGLRYYDERDRMWKMRGDGVCFYAEREFYGNALCVRAGDERTVISRDFTRFASAKFFGRAREVHIFERERFGGRRMELRGDERDLVRAGIRGVFSIRVF